MVDFATASGPELVREYNRMATERGLPTVKRFGTVADGRRRCEHLATTTAAPTAAPVVAAPVRDVFMEFNTSLRKLRGKLIKALFDKKNSQVGIAQLIRAVYDSPNLDRQGALVMVLRGMETTIKKNNMPYSIKKSKSETGAISYGVYDKA